MLLKVNIKSINKKTVQNYHDYFNSVFNNKEDKGFSHKTCGEYFFGRRIFQSKTIFKQTNISDFTEQVDFENPTGQRKSIHQ